MKTITFKYYNFRFFLLSSLPTIKMIVRSISTRDSGIISRGSNRFRRGNFKTVRRQGGTRNGGVDKCQGNGRGFAKTLIEKRFPSTVRKSNITRATSGSFPSPRLDDHSLIPAIEWNYSNLDFRLIVADISIRSFVFRIFFEIIVSSIYSSHRLVLPPDFRIENNQNFYLFISFFFLYRLIFEVDYIYVLQMTFNHSIILMEINIRNDRLILSMHNIF